MDPRIRRTREEQKELVALLESGHPDQRGLMQAIDDWFWAEMLIQKELSVLSPAGTPVMMLVLK